MSVTTLVPLDDVRVTQDDDVVIIQTQEQGPPGLTGPAGPQGPRGPQGIPGPAGPTPVTTVTITTSTATIPSNVRDVYFNVSTPATATLPDAAGWAVANPGADARLLLKDISGNANVNNITINCAGSNMVDGLASFEISMKWGAYTLRVTPSNNWMIVG
jgi:hypothetical protein